MVAVKFAASSKPSRMRVESERARTERVDAGPQVDDAVDAVVVGDTGPHVLDQRGARRFDGHPRHHRARGVSDNSSNDTLCPSCGRQRGDARQRKRHSKNAAFHCHSRLLILANNNAGWRLAEGAATRPPTHRLNWQRLRMSCKRVKQTRAMRLATFTPRKRRMASSIPETRAAPAGYDVSSCRAPPSSSSQWRCDCCISGPSATPRFSPY